MCQVLHIMFILTVKCICTLVLCVNDLGRVSYRGGDAPGNSLSQLAIVPPLVIGFPNL